VESPRVVEALNVVGHVGPHLVAGCVVLSAGAFGLERREEALARRFVSAVTVRAHAAVDAAVGQQSLDFLTCALADLVRVMQQLGQPASAPQCHG